MEEERKVIITTGEPGGPLGEQIKEMEDILIKNAAIPKLEIPKVEIPPIDIPGPEEATATAEQLKQFYPSEQWQDVKEALIKAVKPVVEIVTETAKEFYKIAMECYKQDPEIKKCYGIYKRTRKRKDKKKANDKNK